MLYTAQIIVTNHGVKLPPYNFSNSDRRKLYESVTQMFRGIIHGYTLGSGDMLIFPTYMAADGFQCRNRTETFEAKIINCKGDMVGTIEDIITWNGPMFYEN